MRRLAPIGVYLFVGVVLGYVTFASIMVGVWGVKVSAAQYLAFFGTLGLVVAAITSAFSASHGRRVACVAVVLMAPMWLNGAALLVPRGTAILVAFQWTLVALYLVAMAVGLFYPHRWRWSGAMMTLALLVAVVPAGINTVSAVRDGEYARPVVEYARWTPGTQQLQIHRDAFSVLDDDVVATLGRAGITGQVANAGGDRSDSNGEAHRLVVVLAGQVPAPKRLYYPRGPLVIYLFDGAKWRTIPDDAATFPLFLTVRPDDHFTKIEMERTLGGRSTTTPFSW